MAIIELFKQNLSAYYGSTMISMIISVLSIFVFEAILAFSLISFKYSTKKTIIITATSVVAMLLFNVFLMIVMYEQLALYSMMAVFSVDCVLFVIGVCISKQDLFKSAFAVAVAISFSAISIEIGYLSDFFFGGSPYMKLWLVFVLDTVATVIFLIYIKKDFRQKFIDTVEFLPRNWRYAILVPIAHWFVHNLYMNGIRTPLHFIIMACVNVIVVLSYRFIFVELEKTKHEVERESQMMLFGQQVSALSNQLDAMRDSQKEVRILRHDIKHFAGLVSQLASHGETEKMQEVTKFLNDKLESSEAINEMFCENSVVNASLAYYFKVARSNEIDATCKASVRKDIKLNVVEFSTAIANVIENAINACKKMEDAENRKMSVYINEQNNHVLVQVSNTYSGEVVFDGDGLPIRSHFGGVGIISVCEFATKNNASMNFKMQDDLFVFEMIVPLENQNA